MSREVYIMARVNISLPEYVIADADRRAAKLGTSRSAYIALALSQKAQYDDMMQMMPQMMELMKQVERKIPQMVDSDSAGGRGAGAPA